MISSQANESEVAAILANIEAEHIAAQRGLSGSRDGAARHAFISKREENIGQHYETLASMMPPEQAMGLVITTLAHAENHGGRHAAP
jgi:hypothetical protein